MLPISLYMDANEISLRLTILKKVRSKGTGTENLSGALLTIVYFLNGFYCLSNVG